MGMWFLWLVPILLMMVVVGSRFCGGNDEDEEIGRRTYHGEEEEEIESDEGPKKDTIPLWKYVTRLRGGRGGGTTKFTCLHCNKTYTGSYTHVRKCLCGIMPCDQGQAIEIKTCDKVLGKERNKYRMEEEAAQNNSKRSRVESESPQRMFSGGFGSSSTHASGFSSMRPMLVDSPLCEKHYHISLTLVAKMMWIQKFTSFSMHVVCHSMFLAHPIGMKWYKPSMVPL